MSISLGKVQRIEIRSEDGQIERWRKLGKSKPVLQHCSRGSLPHLVNWFSVEDKDIKEVTEKTKKVIKESEILHGC